MTTGLDAAPEPGASRSDVLLLTEGTAGRHLALQAAAVEGDTAGRVVLVHTAEGAISGLPLGIEQVAIGAGPAGADGNSARRLVAALTDDAAVRSYLPTARIVVAPDGQFGAVRTALDEFPGDVVAWTDYGAQFLARRATKLLRDYHGNAPERLAGLIDEALATSARSGELAGAIEAATARLLDIGGFHQLVELAPRLSELGRGAAPGVDLAVRFARLSVGETPGSGHADSIRGSLDRAAERMEQGDLIGSVRLVTLALRLIYHAELHADGPVSTLVEDPAGTLAPWWDSRFGRYAGSLSTAESSGDEPSPKPDVRVDTGARIVVLAGAFGAFYQPVVDLLTDAGYEPELVHPDEIGPLLTRRSPTEQLIGEWLRLRDPGTWAALPESASARRQLAALRERLAEADIVFADWCDPGAVFASLLVPSTTRLIVRVHRIDAVRAFSQLLAWDRVERVLLVSDHTRHLLAGQLARPGAPLPCALTVVNNIIDVERYRRPKLPGAERRIAVVGWGRRVKDPIFAVEVLRELLRRDPTWRLRLIGRDLPETTATPVAAYVARFRALLDDPRVREAIEWVGFTGRLEAALDECGFTLSSSNVEGWPVGVVEAAASGCIPVIRDWPQVADHGGARAIYADVPEWVVTTAQEAAARIAAVTDWPTASAQAREQAASLSALGATSGEYLALIVGPGPRPGSTPNGVAG